MFVYAVAGEKPAVSKGSKTESLLPALSKQYENQSKRLELHRLLALSPVAVSVAVSSEMRQEVEAALKQPPCIDKGKETQTHTGALEKLIVDICSKLDSPPVRSTQQGSKLKLDAIPAAHKLVTLPNYRELDPFGPTLSTLVQLVEMKFVIGTETTLEVVRMKYDGKKYYLM